MKEVTYRVNVETKGAVKEVDQLNNSIKEKDFIKKVITLDEKAEVTNNLNIINKEKYLEFNSILNNNLLAEDKIENNKLPSYILNNLEKFNNWIE